MPAMSEPPRPRSLRARLLALLLLFTVGLWGASGVLIYIEALQEGRKLFDESLSEAGALLLSLAEHEIEEHGPTLGVQLLRAESRHRHYELEFQIWTADARSAYRTNMAPEQPFMALDATGYGWITMNGERWRTYATWNQRRMLQIQIAEPLTRSKELSTWTFLHLLVLAMVLLPVSMAIIWWILTRSLRPLQKSATAVALRSADDLRPVDAEDAPSEVTPLFAALNRLLFRMREALQLERRFTADAAHELRSPLAAIRATAQVMGGARTREELAQNTADLLASVDRSSRLIDQLLMLARLDSGALSANGLNPVDLASVVQTECEAQRAAASEKNVTLETRIEPAQVHGVANLLGILVRNLVDNAIRYSPAGGRVLVTCGTVSGQAVLSVADDGPGIAPEERERIFERFYRILGNEATGSGLGLSIVRQIVELHSATLEVHEGPGGSGTLFACRFPAYLHSHRPVT